ncbi:AMP-binding protein [Streptomyces sp. NPDC048606]|uniref:AMP-binding protein n=1 Tax=Streptomyces sp. NPDC048606 TaxID=3154726 RepID=UPI00342C6E01
MNQIDTASPTPTGSPPTDTTLPGLFEAQVARTPCAPAVAGPDGMVSYAELNEGANRLARYLVAVHRVGPEDVVGLAVPRSTTAITALLAVSKAGAAYLPLDTAHPARRTSAVLESIAPRLLLTTREQAEALPRTGTRRILVDELTCAGWSAADPTDGDRTAPLRPEHPARLLPTPDPTGTPEGVVTTHAGLVGPAANLEPRFALDGTSRVLQLASTSLDAASTELLMAFACGGTLVLPPPGPLAGEELARTLTDHRVSHALIPPATLATLPHDDFPHLRTLVVGGEACPAELTTRWSPGRRMIDTYARAYPSDEGVCPAPPGAVGRTRNRG